MIADLMGKYRKFLMYIVFGVLTTLVNIFFYALFSRYWFPNLVVSNGLAWVLSVLFAYVTNRMFVFKGAGVTFKVVLKEMTLFLSCRIFSGMLDSGLMIALVNYFKVHDLFAKLIVNTMVVILNYGLSTTLIFKDRNR